MRDIFTVLYNLYYQTWQATLSNSYIMNEWMQNYIWSYSMYYTLWYFLFSTK